MAAGFWSKQKERLTHLKFLHVLFARNFSNICLPKTCSQAREEGALQSQQQPRKSKSGVLFGNSNYPGDGEYRDFPNPWTPWKYKMLRIAWNANIDIIYGNWDMSVAVSRRSRVARIVVFDSFEELVRRRVRLQFLISKRHYKPIWKKIL